MGFPMDILPHSGIRVFLGALSLILGSPPEKFCNTGNLHSQLYLWQVQSTDTGDAFQQGMFVNHWWTLVQFCGPVVQFDTGVVRFHNVNHRRPCPGLSIVCVSGDPITGGQPRRRVQAWPFHPSWKHTSLQKEKKPHTSPTMTLPSGFLLFFLSMRRAKHLFEYRFIASLIFRVSYFLDIGL